MATLASDFLTEGVDNARTGWVRDEKVFTPANVGSTKLLWKVKLESTPRAMHNLFAPLVAERVTTAQGARELAVVAGVSDDLFGIDVATGQQIWHRHFDSTLDESRAARATRSAPADRPAVPTMAQISPGKYTIYAVSWDGRLRQVNLADGQDVGAAGEVHPGRRQAVRAEPAQRRHLHRDRAGLRRPDQRLLFLRSRVTRAPARSSPQAAACGAAAARRSIPTARVYIGTGDAQFDPPNRRLGNGIVGVKLDANKQLQLADYFGAPNANWLWRRDLDVNTTPVAFDYRSRKFLVGTSKECRLWLLDRDALGGEDHRTTLHTTPLICNDAQAFDAQRRLGRAQRVAGPERHAVGAGAVLGAGEHAVQGADRTRAADGRRRRGVQARSSAQGSGSSTPAWLSRDMDLAEEAVIANGVVFAYAAGEDATQVVPDRAWDEPGGPVYGGGLSSGPARRIPTSRHAALYALDGQTGKELWSSGNQIESWNHFSGLTVANGRAYIATFDGVALLLWHASIGGEADARCSV